MRPGRARWDVLGCASLTLPAHSGLRRDITRPISERQPGFDDQFDATTVFYDAIALGSWPSGQLVLVGPPLRNLEATVTTGRIDGRPLGTRITRFHHRDRCCDIWLAAPRVRTVTVAFDFGATQLRPSRAELRRYAGRRVLYTLSKDNDPAWVVDWARFHLVNHGADAVLLYDNGSTRYSPRHLLQTLRAALPGLPVDVVSWPFPYGPGGFSSTSGWDSDFCQAGAFQDARFRFLGRAASVLNTDVDELVISASGRSVFQAAEQDAAGCVAFAGDWIGAATGRRGHPGAARHGDFVHRDAAQLERCPLKWCVVPARTGLEYNWSTHHVRMPGFTAAITDEFGYRHFRAISTDWKYPRSAPMALDPALHRVDRPLEAALDRAGLRGAVNAFKHQA
ncbi:hypothetical protein SAMN05660657_04966 [Geodermatophilus amargosae]|uniref:Uncharacterized protein n=1 Tax=Geodermatophilus amargosae TaxID=1296565 RepID=A0A1I7CW59_9ACTN|nr:hypothetical protein [Geodermatophilus amargosae]SFU03663.1 hypothetical protein SAMN05660657_04966 [Geodermatophilus amargosae]